MYYDFKVSVPKVKGKVFVRKAAKATYVDFQYERRYDNVTKNNKGSKTTIGKLCDDDQSMMYPNPSYYKYFPDEEIPEETVEDRSCVLRCGPYVVIKKIIEDYGLDKMLKDILGEDDMKLFLDLAAYSIIEENNAGQYYPDYAYNHPLFTDNMKIYSDSKVSDFINSLTVDQSVEFLNTWNEKRNKREGIYISYDSTNKTCDAGDVEIAEFGHSKEGTKRPIVNYAIGYDVENKEPLYYQDYPGSLNDMSQLKCMVDDAKSYGYKKIGFVLDRGYFSKENIQYILESGYRVLIIVKGKKDLVNALVMKNKGKFEEERENAVSKYGAYGMTERIKLFEDDKNDSFVHIFFSPALYSNERSKLEDTLDHMRTTWKRQMGKAYVFPETYKEYYEPVYRKEKVKIKDKDGKEKEVETTIFVTAVEKKEEITRQIKLCGYYAIVSSEEMTAKDALILYKSRDASEKIFRGDKSYLGARTERIYSRESFEGKIFIEFIATIIRSKIYTLLKEEVEENDLTLNYMTVPASIKELEKIEMVRRLDGKYHLAHNISKMQRIILKAFDINDIQTKATLEKISSLLKPEDNNKN